MMKLLEQGDKVICPKGHYICQIASDIYYGDRFQAINFENFVDGFSPVEGEYPKPCPECGEHWIAFDNPKSDISVLIEGKGWVPPRLHIVK